MSVADFVAARLAPEEDAEEEEGFPGIRVTIRLDAEYGVKLDEGAHYLSMKRTGCATELLKRAIDDMVSAILARDEDWASTIGLALAEVGAEGKF